MLTTKLQDIDPEVLLNHGQHEGLRELLADYKMDKVQTLLVIESYILTGDYRHVNKLLNEWSKRLEPEYTGRIMYFKIFLLESVEEHKNTQLVLRTILRSMNAIDEKKKKNEIDKAWLLLALSRSLYFYSTNLAEGGIYAQQAINIFSWYNLVRPESYAWQLLGAHLIKVKDYSGAEETFLKALDLRRNLNNPQLVGQTATSLASVALKLHRYLSARNYFFTALEEGYRLGPEMSYKFCQTWYNIGILSYKMAELETGREAFQLAMMNARKNQYVFLPDILYYLGQIESLLNQSQQAKFYYKQALLIYERSLTPSKDLSNQILKTVFFYLQQLVLVNNKEEFHLTYLNYTMYLNSNIGKIYKTLIDIFSQEFETKTAVPVEFYHQILLECEKYDKNSLNSIIEYSLNRLVQSTLKNFLTANNTDTYTSLYKILTKQYQYATEQNNIFLQIQILFCRALLSTLHNPDRKLSHEDFRNALELANNSELPWHYGFITKYSNLIMNSKYLSAEQKELVEELLKECCKNFLVVLNTFIGSMP